MNLKMKLQKIENSKKEQNKKNEQVTWLEKVYSKDARFVSSKIYSK